MQVLKIENNHGYYILNFKQKEITEINKDDLFDLLEIIYENEDIIMDEINDQSQILNDAEKVIYKNIYEYFVSFLSSKDVIKNEIENEFQSIRELITNEKNM